MRLKFWHLLVGTGIGMMPGTIATIFFGDQIKASLRNGGGLNWWIVGGMAILLVIGAFGVRQWFKRMAGKGPAKKDRNDIKAVPLGAQPH